MFRCFSINVSDTKIAALSNTPKFQVPKHDIYISMVPSIKLLVSIAHGHQSTPAINLYDDAFINLYGMNFIKDAKIKYGRILFHSLFFSNPM